MRGFDPRWRDVPHSIIGITREIWEERRVASLRQAPGLVVRSPAGLVVGSEAVIAATMATLAEFPDRELPGEDRPALPGRRRRVRLSAAWDGSFIAPTEPKRTAPRSGFDAGEIALAGTP